MESRQQLNISDSGWVVLDGFAATGLRQRNESLETDPWTSGTHTCHEESPMSEVGGDLRQFCFTYFLKGHLLSIFLSSLFAGAS